MPTAPPKIDSQNTRLARDHGHLLQSPAWGELKSHFGWTPCRIALEASTAQALFKQLPLGFSLAYLPKGPRLDWTDADRCQKLFAALHAEARARRAIFLKVEPNLWQDEAQAQIAILFLQRAGFTPADTIQPRTTILIDLAGDEDSILAAMKQKTRYNIRLAPKKGVTLRQGNRTDLEAFYRLSCLTAGRDGFGIHQASYYETAFDLFAPEQCALFLAELADEPLAGLMVFRSGPWAYYFYGASSDSHRNLMAPYALQWAAIQWAKRHNCTVYDLWGIPDAEPARLEAEFDQRSDGLWGVYRFKRGFGGRYARSIGAYDYVYNPMLYRLYRWRRGTAE
ncbi:MAG TPA: peptidoglycan bridge formation glycyltransferase FemA/FemB family protein [Anaerolineae bacterium]|nr:peptidoglycan bridge formation glycyltransferase FemA/FemB family protein [Anaerolineae bacterium]